MSLGWEVKRRKVHHQEPQKYDMVWEFVTTFNLTWCDKTKCVVIGLLYGCGAFQKLEISSKSLE